MIDTWKRDWWELNFHHSCWGLPAWSNTEVLQTGPRPPSPHSGYSGLMWRQRSLNGLRCLWVMAERSEMLHTKRREACLICLGACQTFRYDRNRWSCRTTSGSKTSSSRSQIKKNMLFHLGSSFQKELRLQEACKDYANQKWLIETQLIISHLYTACTQWRV